VIAKLNQVIRGTAQYFAADFSACRWMFRKLDSRIRMRLRCLKRKRKNDNDNPKLRFRYFRRKLGLLTLEEFCTVRHTCKPRVCAFVNESVFYSVGLA